MSIRDVLDISAYLVVGPENTLGRPVRDIVAAAVSAGFTCVQIRSKTAGARELIGLTREAAAVIAAARREESVALLVDDRLDVVLAARQQGVKVDAQWHPIWTAVGGGLLMLGSPMPAPKPISRIHSGAVE